MARAEVAWLECNKETGNLELGSVGRLNYGFHVKQVLTTNFMRVAVAVASYDRREGAWGGAEKTVWITDYPTDGLADDDLVKPKEAFEVLKPFTRYGETLFVLRPLRASGTNR